MPDSFDQLPDEQRETLRPLFFSPDHTATAASVAERCYYPDAQVATALQALVESGLVTTVQPGPNAEVYYRPVQPMLDQMRALNQQADANLRNALNDAKWDLGD